MKTRPAALWRWDGTLDRGPYAIIGLLLSIVKYGIDSFVVWNLCGRTWTPLNYWLAGDRFGDLLYGPTFAAARWTLLGTALPFIWIGVSLTIRRLRSAGAPLWLVALFFVPGLNFLLFIVLMLTPGQRTALQAQPGKSSMLGRMVPRSGFASALTAMLVSVIPIVLLILLGVQWLKHYGWALFIGTPFLAGFFSTVFYEYHEPRRLKASMGVALMSLGLLAVALLFLAIEGIYCILMASPMATGMALFGTVIAHSARTDIHPKAGRTLLGLIGALPLLMGMEKEYEPEPPLREIRTSIEIEASPARVWSHVVSFTEIPPPTDMLFRTGLSYPLRAEIKGHGVGAVRHCVFTTGPFVEPIEAWDEPRLLAFGVVQQPAPMEEWTPYPEIHPPHLEGYFASKKGQFLLQPLPGGKTLLEGTTWYTHRLWPTAYWGLWSDAIIHRIHLRVLAHVKALAEARP